jgi:branched-chain amino acid transport system permease protein
MTLFFFTLMYAVCASAWNILGGYSGYISLGHAAFFGVGAYAIAITFTHTGIGGGYRPFYVLPLVGIAVALISVPVGWIAFRTRAATFAIVTISFLFVVQLLAFNLHSVTSGAQGLALPTPSFPVSSYEHPYYYAMLGLLAISVFTSWYVRGSKLGLALLAIRDDEDRTRGLGVQTELAKLAAFAASAGLIAMAGGLWAYYITFVYPQFAVDPLVTIGMVLMVYLGGRGTIWGPVLGAFILIPAQQEMNDRLGASSLYLVGYSAVFLAVMLLLPRGILPSLADQVRRIRSRWQPTKREPEVVAP